MISSGLATPGHVQAFAMAKCLMVAIGSGVVDLDTRPRPHNRFAKAYMYTMSGQIMGHYVL